MTVFFDGFRSFCQPQTGRFDPSSAVLTPKGPIQNYLGSKRPKSDKTPEMKGQNVRTEGSKSPKRSFFGQNKIHPIIGCFLFDFLNTTVILIPCVFCNENSQLYSVE